MMLQLHKTCEAYLVGDGKFVQMWASCQMFYMNSNGAGDKLQAAGYHIHILENSLSLGALWRSLNARTLMTGGMQCQIDS